jgi:hypothetical protein
MGKRNKQQRPPAKAAAARNDTRNDNRESAQLTTLVADPPAKSPMLLGISLFLFAAWFLFLLVTALLA